MTLQAPRRETPFLLGLILIVTLGARSTGSTQTPVAQASKSPLNWESPARWRRPIRSIAGTLILGPEGIEFRAHGRDSHRWPFIEIKTFALTPRRLVLTTYQNKGWHWPGDRRYRFDLTRPAPSAAAVQLAELVGKPVINGDPSSRGGNFASIPARHRTLTGGTNGTLRFSDEGIAYVTVRGRGGRSWRWADIQTLAHPDLYHFTVGGYRETYSFELKQAMSQALFDRLWDFVYGRGLQMSVKGGHSEGTSGVAQTGMDEER